MLLNRYRLLTGLGKRLLSRCLRDRDDAIARECRGTRLLQGNLRLGLCRFVLQVHARCHGKGSGCADRRVIVSSASTTNRWLRRVRPFFAS